MKLTYILILLILAFITNSCVVGYICGSEIYIIQEEKDRHISNNEGWLKFKKSKEYQSKNSFPIKSRKAIFIDSSYLYNILDSLLTKNNIDHYRYSERYKQSMIPIDSLNKYFFFFNNNIYCCINTREYIYIPFMFENRKPINDHILKFDNSKYIEIRREPFDILKICDSNLTSCKYYYEFLFWEFVDTWPGENFYRGEPGFRKNIWRFKKKQYRKLKKIFHNTVRIPPPCHSPNCQ